MKNLKTLYEKELDSLVNLSITKFKAKICKLSKYQLLSLFDYLVNKLAFQQIYGNDRNAEKYYERRLKLISDVLKK